MMIRQKKLEITICDFKFEKIWICKNINLVANVCGYTPINLGKIIKEGVLADVPSIHRMTIDMQVARGKTDISG
ncbi:MAG: hypothetical protein IJZ23_04670 [Roseburia sp.]|nr:hypothetical protein [Roseburia sp.]